MVIPNSRTDAPYALWASGCFTTWKMSRGWFSWASGIQCFQNHVCFKLDSAILNACYGSTQEFSLTVLLYLPLTLSFLKKSNYSLCYKALEDLWAYSWIQPAREAMAFVCKTAFHSGNESRHGLMGRPSSTHQHLGPHLWALEMKPTWPKVLLQHE